jgi:hypothetical protein
MDLGINITTPSHFLFTTISNKLLKMLATVAPDQYVFVKNI